MGLCPNYLVVKSILFYDYRLVVTVTLLSDAARSLFAMSTARRLLLFLHGVEAVIHIYRGTPS